MKAVLVGLGDVGQEIARALAERAHSIVADAADCDAAIRAVRALDGPCELVFLRGAAAAAVHDCAALRATSACADAVILALFDESHGLASLEELLEAGADDFCAQTGSPAALRQRLLVAERVVRVRLARDSAFALEAAEQERAREALQDLTESLATTLNSIGDGVIACDVSGAVVRMNPMAEKLTGWTLGAAAGRPIADVFKVVDGGTRAPIANPVERALAKGVVVGLANHAYLQRRDGTEVPVADSCAPIKRAAGPCIGAVLVFRDTSAELKARQLLALSERMASVGTLAAGVAHEINNPLTYLVANLEMLLEEIRSLAGGSSSGRWGELEEMVLEARQGAERVRKIVRGLKTFSRGDEERRVVIDVVPVVELAINIAFNEIRHRARLVKDFGKIPLVVADDSRLGQVFINLLVNAAQSLPDGMSEVNEIRITTCTDEAGSAVIEIRDTGPGMSASVVARIFDPFYTTKPIGVGTGLGLSICQNIVTGLGGEISVVSAAGQGTCFRIALPPATVQRVALPSAPPKTASGPRAAVLVVDDEPAIGMALRRILRDHDVTVLTSGQAAIDLLASGESFDVILSDLMMPEMSGMELYRALATGFPVAAERMIFITGGAFTPSARAFLESVPNGRIEKPFDAATVRALVQESRRPTLAPAEAVGPAPLC